MPLILAIEPDRRQASKIAMLARSPLKADLLVTESTERAIEALAKRVPDLILTSALLSPKDEAALADRLRELDASGQHVQTLVIPVFASATGRSRSPGGLLKRLRGTRVEDTAPAGCDPAVFAAQIAEYLEKAAADRLAAATALEEALEDQASNLAPPPVFAPAPVRQAEPDLGPEPILHPEPVLEPRPIFRAEPVLEPRPIFHAEPVMEAGPMLHEEPVLRPTPILRPVPVMPPEPMFYPESASTDHASPAAPDPWEVPKDETSHGEAGRPEEPWEEIVLEEKATEPFDVHAIEAFEADAPRFVLPAESIDVAAFVKQLSDSLLAATPGPRVGPAVETESSIEPEPIELALALEGPTATSEAETAFEGLEDADEDTDEADTELWTRLAAVVRRRWPRLEGKLAHTTTSVEAALPRRAPAIVAAPAAPRAASVRAAAPARRDAVSERIEARMKKRQNGVPAPVQDEWGFFNPEECGFAALLAKLDEVTMANRSPGKRRV